MLIKPHIVTFKYANMIKFQIKCILQDMGILKWNMSERHKEWKQWIKFVENECCLYL